MQLLIFGNKIKFEPLKGGNKRCCSHHLEGRTNSCITGEGERSSPLYEIREIHVHEQHCVMHYSEVGSVVGATKDQII